MWEKGEAYEGERRDEKQKVYNEGCNHKVQQDGITLRAETWCIKVVLRVMFGFH